MPLHYSLRALLSSIDKDKLSQAVRDDVGHCADEVVELINRKSLDAGGQMQRRISQLKLLIKPAAAP